MAGNSLSHVISKDSQEHTAISSKAAVSGEKSGVRENTPPHS